MAIQSLGTRVLNIGNVPQTFDSFDYNRNRAYLFFATVNVELPNNIQSFIRVRPIITPNNLPTFFHPEYYDYPISVQGFAFWVPMSRNFDNNGTCVIQMERLPNVPQSGDLAGDVTIMVEYDDSNDVVSWRR